MEKGGVTHTGVGKIAHWGEACRAQSRKMGRTRPKLDDWHLSSEWVLGEGETEPAGRSNMKKKRRHLILDVKTVDSCSWFLTGI